LDGMGRLSKERALTVHFRSENRHFLGASAPSIHGSERGRAENQGGTLGDGFIGLGVPDVLVPGNYFYELSVTTPGQEGTVPEPSSVALVLFGLGAFALVTFRRMQSGHY
jgi:hypothetical protein